MDYFIREIDVDEFIVHVQLISDGIERENKAMKGRKIMANKVLEMAIAIKGKLDGGLSSSVSKASQELNKLSNATKDQQAQYRKLQAISQKTGNASDRNAAIAAEQKLNSMLQRQAQVAI